MSIAYFDASAFLKLLLSEPGSATAKQAWAQARTVTGGRLLYAEVRAGLAAALRSRRLSARRYADRKRALHELWERVVEVDATTGVVLNAGDLAEQEALTGFDAVHLSSALRSRAGVLVCADARLIREDRSCQLTVIDARS
jgi:predicted nucleic acid-binding protein